jgi:hypothetical protein
MHTKETEGAPQEAYEGHHMHNIHTYCLFLYSIQLPPCDDETTYCNNRKVLLRCLLT